MKNYQDLIRRIIETGTREVNRTGTATLSVVSGELRWNMADGIPGVTTKKLAVRPVVGEALWFMAGSSDIKALRKLTDIGPDDFCIWQQNLDELNARRAGSPEYDGCDDYLGYVYGPAWRNKYGAEEAVDVDQIQILINNINAIKENPAHPSRRRLIVDTWDATVHNDSASLDCALPPCHYGFQCFVQGDKLSLKWIQRSVN